MQNRNHNRDVFERFGRDKGADIPQQTEYVSALKPLLDRFGNEPAFTLILFTLELFPSKVIPTVLAEVARVLAGWLRDP